MSDHQRRREDRKRAYLDWLEWRKGEVPEGSYRKPILTDAEQEKIKETGDLLCTAWVFMDELCDALPAQDREHHSKTMSICLNMAFEMGATCFISEAGAKFLRKSMASKGGIGGKAPWHAQAQKHVSEILAGGGDKRGLAKAVDKRWQHSDESPRPKFKALSNYVSSISKNYAGQKSS